MSAEIHIRGESRQDEFNENYDKVIFEVTPQKKIDSENTSQISSLLSAIIDGGAKKILLSMKDVGNVDSTGIGMLINTTRKIRNKEGELVLCNILEEVKNIMNLVKLPQFVNIYNTEKEAVEYLEKL